MIADYTQESIFSSPVKVERLDRKKIATDTALNLFYLEYSAAIDPALLYATRLLFSESLFGCVFDVSV